MNRPTETDIAKAEDLLQKASTPAGFTAAVNEHDNYQRVWARDGTICTLAALLTGKQELIATGKATLETLFARQHRAGFIPSNVEPANGAVSYGTAVGRVDNVCWPVIGICQLAHMTGEKAWAQQFLPQVEKCFQVLEAWEFNGRGLVYVPQSGDWADEYIQHGYILYDQLLRLWALRSAAALFNRSDWQADAEQLKLLIQTNFWNNQQMEGLYSIQLKNHLEKAPVSFWFLGFNPSRIYSQFDLQANALALLLGIGNEQQDKTLIELLQQMMQAMQHILPSFYPTIETGDADMAELENNYAYSFRNKPFEFHNGGLWPVWNGWLAAALTERKQGDMAATIHQQIKKANALHNDEFNECLHGQSLQPAGVPHCAWSAAGEIIAARYRAGSWLL